MKKLFSIAVLLCTVNMLATDGKSLAIKLGLSASSKASTQWNRVFKKERKMKKYGIHKLNSTDRLALKTYLMDYAADSDTPEAAGI